MIRIKILLGALLISSASLAQNWVDVGLKGGYGLNVLYNQNFFDDNRYSYQRDMGYTFGGKFGFNMDVHEITVDLMSSKFGGSLGYKDSLTTYDTRVSYSTFDILLMYRSNKGASYAEIGPKYSMVSGPSQSFSSGGPATADAKDFVRSSYVSIVAGFGGYIFGTENFGITLGPRFSYAVSDLVTKAGIDNDFLSSNHYDGQGKYAGTHPFSILLVMELNFDLGYIAKAPCNKRTKIMFF